MATIPFDVKFRPQIESGEYKVVTRDRKPVRILCWDRKGDWPIMALAAEEDGLESYINCYSNGRNTYGEQEEEWPYDLFIVTPEPELVEWSDEDERMWNSALWHIKNSCGNGGKNSGEFEVYNWLKSLRSRIAWKPSEEQMEALEGILSRYRYCLEEDTRKQIESLCNDLKKL